MKWIPRDSREHSVCVVDAAGRQVTTPVVRRLYGMFRCIHNTRRNYTRTDRSVGPGLFSDSYKGMVCVDCGAIIWERYSNYTDISQLNLKG